MIAPTFCPENQTLNIIWANGGLTPCFAELVSWIAVFGATLLLGTLQIILFCKYSVRVGRPELLTTRLYKCHLVLHLLLCLIAITQVLAVSEKKGIYYWYQIVVAITKVMTWVAAIGFLLLERRRHVLLSNSKGHGLTLLAVWSLSVIALFLPLVSWYSSMWWWRLQSTEDIVRFSFWITELLLVFMVFIIGLRAPALEVSVYNRMSNDDQSPNDQNRSAWTGFLPKVKMLAPLVWPKGSFTLQLCVIISALLLVAGRVANLGVPIYYKLIVDNVEKEFCWNYILVWVVLRFLQGGGAGGAGALSDLRDFLWIGVSQYTTRSTQLKLFGHLHNLSLRWHLSKKTGEVLRSMDRGTSSIDNLLNYFVFSILPTIADIIIAIVYFISAFDVYFGLIVFATMALYVVATIMITEWRTKFKRAMNTLDNACNTRAVDSLVNFETVKYYGNADYEVKRLEEAITEYQKAEWQTMATLGILNSVQNIVITVGLLGGSFLCAWYIHDGDTILQRKVTVGDFVLFGTYLVQLYGPLNYFGSYYRLIQNSFIDMENMFDLLSEKQEVKDNSDAPALLVKKGVVEFKDVHFRYEDARPVLRGISFCVPAGMTYALVGPSGAGKSSIIRLLFRFYDVQRGTITIDGQDISQVQQDSLRKSIGIVPQDTVLFNTDIKYNIGYGNTSASDDSIISAATAADIHNRILSFPEEYKTIVGERGLKLSGGEKQRVAIARTLLKNPRIILLDEATSALDTQTERNILRSFEEICANKTTLVVAHRLSTIIHADQILVLDDGLIKERGTHEELLALQGMYFKMWSEQLKKKESPELTEFDDSSQPLVVN